MIGLVRRRGAADIPAAFKGSRLRDKAERLARLFFEAQATGKFEFDSSQWKPAKDALKLDTHGKCAYCEAPTSVVAHGDVEHFRPKSIYWWLAFFYDNYLFSCQICNQNFKGDNFPLTGAREQPPAMPASHPTGAALTALVDLLTHDPQSASDDDLRQRWAAEDADLVDPYLQNPEPLFRYEVDVNNEEVWIRSAGGARADRAIAASEKYLGLNREELRRERFVMYAPLAAFGQLLSIPGLPATARQMSEAEVVRMQAASEPFAGMRRFFARIWGLPPAA